MTVFIALLRGINVGGNNKAPMADLRALMEGAGFRNVRTYIKSGNIVLDAGEGDGSAVGRRIEAAMAQRFGFSAKVMVMTGGELAAALAESPFKAEAADPAKVHIGILAGEPAPEARAALAAKPCGPDRYQLAGRGFTFTRPMASANQCWRPTSNGRSMCP